MAMDALELGARTLLIVVFATAGASKVRSHAAFASFRKSVSAFGVRRTAAVAICIPPAELLAAVLLATAPVAGHALAVALLAVLIAAAAGALREGRPVHCRCFGSRAAGSAQLLIVRNAVLLAVAAAGVSIRLAGPSPTGMAGSWAAAGLGAVAALVLMRLDDLAYLLRSPRSRPT